MQMKVALALLSLASGAQSVWNTLLGPLNPPTLSARFFITESMLWSISGRCLMCLPRCSLSGLAESHSECFPALGWGTAAWHRQVALPGLGGQQCLMLQIRSCRFSALKCLMAHHHSQDEDPDTHQGHTNSPHPQPQHQHSPLAPDACPRDPISHRTSSHSTTHN